MAVLRENPDLQRGLLDAAVDTTSAAVVAHLTFSTYFSLTGDADIDSDADDSHLAEHRHHNLSSYFSDEENYTSSPSGGEDELPLDTFFLSPSLTPGSSCVTKRNTKSRSHLRLAVMSLPMTSTRTVISSGRFTIPPRNLFRGSEVRFARRTARSKIPWTLINGRP